MSDKKQHRQTEACNAENVTNLDADAVKKSDKSQSTAENEGAQKSGDISGDIKALKDELEAVRAELDEKSKKCDDYLDKFQRTVAEFDNFKKRSIKEKEALYIDAASDVIKYFLPAMDNTERALQAIAADSSAQTLKDGVEMVFKQIRDAFKSIGVEEIKAVNETFDPMLHNAVMHVDDESLGHNAVVEEFQKGYIYKDKVIRYSMVKVAN